MRIVLAFLFILASTAAYGDSRGFAVRLRVSGDLENEVSSYMSRELRALGDVRVVDEDYDFTIHTLVMELKDPPKGVVISVVIQQRVDLSFLKERLTLKDLEDEFDSLTSDLARDRPDHWLRIGPNDELRGMCTKIVTDFDSEILEPLRKMREKLWGPKSK